jgi:hypothetical protein
MKTTKEQDEKIQELIQNTEFLNKLDYDYLINNLEDLNDLEENFQELINEYELIYYSDCINFLKEYDPSLNGSLLIAYEYGYTPKNLNSEILATLLIQSYMNEELNEILEELNEILEEETEEN